MATDIDVHQLLLSYAQKNHIYEINYRNFASALSKQFRAADQSIPIYRDLVLNPDVVLVPKLINLAQKRKIAVIFAGNNIETIRLPESCLNPLIAEYARIEEFSEVPFPDDETLKLSIPPEWIVTIGIDDQFKNLLDAEEETNIPICRITFPEGIKSMIIPIETLRNKLLEFAILKIRHYLRKGANKDYIQQRLLGAFPTKDMLVRDSMTCILIKPYDLISEIQNAKSDFTFPFVAYLNNSVRKDILGKGEHTPDDTAVLQASYIMDLFTNYYKSKAQRFFDRENAFKTLETLLSKAPYAYSIDDICDFRDSQARPLLGKYTREELENWLKEKTSTKETKKLPQLLIITVKNQQLFIKQEFFLPYIVNLINNTRSGIRAKIIHEWQQVMYQFEKTPAMLSDDDFNKYLSYKIDEASPALSQALASGFAPLVYQEIYGSKGEKNNLSSLFGNLKQAPLNQLMHLDRQQLLTDVTILLPIWYTIPILSWFYKLIKRIGTKKVKKGTTMQQEKSVAKPENNRAQEFSQIAAKLEHDVVPANYTIDQYMMLLIDKWNTLINLEAKRNLVEDINSLVRDYLRKTLRTMKPSSLTLERIDAMANNLLRVPALMQIKNHGALREYIKTYFLKLLKR